MEPWIETVQGRKFWFTEEEHENEIHIEDIALALSKTCRFTGHCNKFYSVAEHSFYVSLMTDDLKGLLHDASEAYLADIASPVKQLLPDYKKLEELVMRKIAKAFDLPEGFDKEPHVKEADWGALKTEAKYLLPSGGKDWYFPPDVKGMPVPPAGLSSDAAGIIFLQRFWELKNGNSDSNS